MCSFHVWSEVCLAPFHVQSKVCIAPIYVRRKFADFAPHIEQRHSFRDQQNAQIAIFAKYILEFFKTPIFKHFSEQQYFEGEYL